MRVTASAFAEACAVWALCVAGLSGCVDEFEATPHPAPSDFEGLPPVARLDEGLDWRLPPRPPREQGVAPPINDAVIADAAVIEDAATVEDARPSSPDATRGCRLDRECALAVDLRACAPCPVGVTTQQLDLDPCLTPFIMDQPMPTHAPGCQGDCDHRGLCLQLPFEAICFDGACQAIGGVVGD
ncbi:hypothetical protein KKF91_22025 [Myxococcota bacterium]|nr:hypothetical protein [Myxococcota bacterium]MBU1433220.1 hypothetical protein [Myxococcota bacterium]MBU1899969.1 hypothetical protein [Myxococcota bacterium]